MAQFLSNELLIIAFKELLNETSFEYMSSIYTVCKKWKKLIELVLIEEIEFRLKNELLIEYDCGDCSTKNISYDFLNSTFNIFINDNHSKPYFSNVPENIEKRKIHVSFQYKNYDNETPYFIEFNLGTLLFSFEKYEIRSNINWNYKDCMCIYTKEFITIEKLIISLQKMCIILDLLDEKLSVDKYQYKYIIKRPVFDMFDYDTDDFDVVDFGGFGGFYFI
ncbi:hypothetical protein C1645_409457 [Glomus cerebriforme]|uniref:F-box domain-containing protein n=1 Tax=Glomus cerebriforme TaxID=658196 RepID=A0A397TE71_9GLOM|nr:hypothetical protein C1645_409457 [Glomus cerebriforme]